MRVGVFVTATDLAATLEGQIQQAVDAETDSFDSFWTSQVTAVDALTLLALAGQRTQRTEAGTAVVPIFSRHPIAMAQQALTTNAALGGRLLLGIGLSHKPTIEGRYGMSFDRPALRMREYLSILRSLVHRGTVNFRGQAYSADVTIQVPDARPFPVLVAALGPRMLQIAGELAEGTVTWMVGRKTLEAHIVPGITRAAEAAGRPRPRICVGVPIAVTDDPQAALETAARVFRRYGELPSYRRMLDMEGAESPAEVAIVGTEREVEQQLRFLADAGATDLLASIFRVGSDQRASVARTRALLKALIGKI